MLSFPLGYESYILYIWRSIVHPQVAALDELSSNLQPLFAVSRLRTAYKNEKLVPNSTPPRHIAKSYKMFSASRLYLSQVQSQLRGPLRVHGLVNSGSACRASQQNATTTTRASVPCINRWYRLVQTESGSPPGDEPPKKRKSSRKAKIEIGTPAMVGAVAESSEVPQVKKRRAKRKATGADEAVVPGACGYNVQSTKRDWRGGRVRRIKGIAEGVAGKGISEGEADKGNSGDGAGWWTEMITLVVVGALVLGDLEGKKRIGQGNADGSG